MTVLGLNFIGMPANFIVNITDVTALKKDDMVNFCLLEKDSEGYYQSVVNRDFDTIKPDSVTLSERELEILNLLEAGKSSKEIATLLTISEHTVNTHRKNMLKKTQSKNTADLIKRNN
jgi:DNA-binding CsgD family transcriptional regulator